MSSYPSFAKAKEAAIKVVDEEYDHYLSIWTHDEKLGDDVDVQSTDHEEPVPFFIKLEFDEDETVRLWVEPRDANGRSVIPESSWTVRPERERYMARQAREDLKKTKAAATKAAKANKDGKVLSDELRPSDKVYIILSADGYVRQAGNLPRNLVYKSLRYANMQARSLLYQSTIDSSKDAPLPAILPAFAEEEFNVDSSTATYVGRVKGKGKKVKSIWVEEMSFDSYVPPPPEGSVTKGKKKATGTSGQKRATPSSGSRVSTDTAKRGRRRSIS
ncbi:hypothetical protein BD324DRAFT_651137 [Kockovaella imperatae]|uniref:Uncharacterized protein n=1 Tax=Kockovaella imperatae TaxID=4999 RepID=A0A1Y1UF02_9TREE|nr:hypothetical protein BD324DRAFT_651137 [Kockovaella imperatae]ORX36651.1 hypothetical protein BD324DRAFT_651137 [Kockovaella imperatae]